MWSSWSGGFCPSPSPSTGMEQPTSAPVLNQSFSPHCVSPWKPPGAVPKLGVPRCWSLLPALAGSARGWEGRQTWGCLTIKPGASWERRGHFPATSPCTLLPLAIPAAMKQTEGMCLPGNPLQTLPHTHRPCCQVEQGTVRAQAACGKEPEACRKMSPWDAGEGPLSLGLGVLVSKEVWRGFMGGSGCAREGLCFLLLAPAAPWGPGEPSQPSLKSPVDSQD